MTLILGVGNRWRGDDAAGLEVARRAGGEEHEGDGSGLLERWAGAGAVIVVDAAAAGAPAGTIRRFDARAEPLPAELLRSSTHAFGVAEAVELARVLDRLPPRLTVYAIEGSRFVAGEALTPAVAAAVGVLAARLVGRVLVPRAACGFLRMHAGPAAPTIAP